MKNLKSVIFVLLAGCMWGCMGLLVRPLNICGLESMNIVALRAWVTFGFMFLTFPLLCKIQQRKVKNEIRIKLKDIWIFVGTGIVSVVFFNYCYFTTIVLTDLSVAAIMLYTAPVFVMLISAVVFKEALNKKKLLALVMAFIGCGVVTGAFTGSLNMTPAGILFGLGAGVGYALYSIFGKLATDRGYSSLTVTIYTFLFASLGVLPFVDAGEIVSIFVSQPGMILYCILMIIWVTCLPYILYTAGLAGMEPGMASVVACIEPVAATLVGVIAYGEKPGIYTIAGVILVLAAIALINIRIAPKNVG